MKRGLNLGCGRIIMPTMQPVHHRMLPESLYTDRDIQWDNVDQHAMPGVTVATDLFRYPWPLESDAYDVALATHLVEHIPHAVLRDGQLEKLTGGWWAWWEELGRVLKPGGIVYIVTPYAGSRSATCDPTHTRYIMPQTFGYFRRNPSAPFDYQLKYEWLVMYGPVVSFTGTIMQLADAEAVPDATRDDWYLRQNTHHVDVVEDFGIGLQVEK